MAIETSAIRLYRVQNHDRVFLIVLESDTRHGAQAQHSYSMASLLLWSMSCYYHFYERVLPGGHYLAVTTICRQKQREATMPCPRPRLSMQHCCCWLLVSFSTATSVVSQLFPSRFFVEQSVPALREARVSAAVRSKAGQECCSWFGTSRLLPRRRLQPRPRPSLARHSPDSHRTFPQACRKAHRT